MNFVLLLTCRSPLGNCLKRVAVTLHVLGRRVYVCPRAVTAFFCLRAMLLLPPHEKNVT